MLRQASESGNVLFMLIHASGPVYPGFYLLTFGGSCHYLLERDGRSALFDPGLSVHLPYLYQRIAAQPGLGSCAIKDVFLTHLHADRTGGIPRLRKNSPSLVVHGSALMQQKLSDEQLVREIYEQDIQLSKLYPQAASPEPMEFEEFRELLRIDRVFPESEVFEISEDLRVRCTRAPGHTEESLAYLVEPYDFLVVDESFGYFRGRELAAPGADWDIAENIQTLNKFKDVELSAICFPNVGLITGQLVRDHVQNMLQNMEDLLTECRKAFKAGLSDEEVRASLQRSFYTSTSKDPLVAFLLEHTFLAIWEQVRVLRQEPNKSFTS